MDASSARDGCAYFLIALGRHKTTELCLGLYKMKVQSKGKICRIYSPELQVPSILDLL